MACSLTACRRWVDTLVAFEAFGSCLPLMGSHVDLILHTPLHQPSPACRRFGVAQRRQVRDKCALPPHVLYMTATPIPRTSALVAFGDTAQVGWVG